MQSNNSDAIIKSDVKTFVSEYAIGLGGWGWGRVIKIKIH